MHENDNSTAEQCWQKEEVMEKKGEGSQFIEIAAVSNGIILALA